MVQGLFAAGRHGLRPRVLDDGATNRLAQGVIATNELAEYNILGGAADELQPTIPGGGALPVDGVPPPPTERPHTPEEELDGRAVSAFGIVLGLGLGLFQGVRGS